MWEVTSSTSTLPPDFPLVPPNRLSRPGLPAPLRAFGPGSRSCDVISKASALSSASQPCPAGPSALGLFTEPGRGEGRRNGPPLLQAGRSRPHPDRVSTCNRAHLRDRPRARGRPRPKHPLPSSLATLTIAILLHFAIPARRAKTRTADKKLRRSAQEDREGEGTSRAARARSQNVNVLSNVGTPEAEESGTFPPPPASSTQRGSTAKRPDAPAARPALFPEGGKIGGDQ